MTKKRNSYTRFYKEDKENIYIKKQKIALNKIDINTLFYNLFLDNAKIKYAYLGSRGCELSLSLHNKKD